MIYRFFKKPSRLLKYPHHTAPNTPGTLTLDC